MSSTTTSEISAEVKKYILIFASLLALSMLSVGISYLKLSLPLAIFIALSISAIQIFFAAGYFMHLISEKNMMLYVILLFTLTFLIAILALVVWQKRDPIPGTTFSISPAATAHENAHPEDHHDVH